MYPSDTQNAKSGARKTRIGQACLVATPNPLHNILSQACWAALATEQTQLKEQLFRAIVEDGQALR